MATIPALRTCALAALLLAMPAHSDALPVPATPPEALHSMMAARHAAQALASPQATQAQLRQAAEQLKELRALLDQEPWIEFGASEPYIYAERLNLGLPLASIYARLGEKDKALEMLEAITGVLLTPALSAALTQDPAFASLKDEPRFQAVLAKMQRGGGIASRNSFSTPFKEQLSKEERIAGLSLFWSEVRQNFANVDLMPEMDWDALYLDYIKKVLDADSTHDYYRVLMQLAPKLGDGHTNIYAPAELHQQFHARPPIQTALVEGKVIVTKILTDDVGTSLAVGDEIESIDGMPVHEYARTRVLPYVSASTEQDRHVRMYTYELLMGAESSPVELTLRNRHGKTSRLSLPRAGWSRPAQQDFAFQVSSDGIAYFHISHFGSAAGVKAFKQALPEILRAKGLILDLRDNGGGSSHYGFEILSYLTGQPLKLPQARVRFEDQSLRAQGGDFVSWRPLKKSALHFEIPAEQRYNGPVTVLIGPKTFSAAEDFASVFQQMGRGELVGEATGGSTGQPLFLQLPGGGTARICIKRDMHADGTEFVGKGIAPTRLVKNSITAIRNGADVVRSAAEQALIRGAATPLAAISSTQ